MVHVTYLQLLGVIALTLLIWQLLVLIVCQFAADEDVIISFSVFLWMPFVMVMRAIIPKVKLLRSRKYNCYQFFGSYGAKKKDGAMEARWQFNLCMTPEMAKRFKQVGKDEVPTEYCIRLLREGKEFKSPAHKLEILKEEHLKNGMPTQGLTKEFLSKFLT